MSNLPEIDADKIEQKLLTRLIEQTKQNVRLEALAEAIRDERDEAREQCKSLTQQLGELRDKVEMPNEDSDGE